MPVTRTPSDRSPVQALELLALARRGAAHEVNNLLAVIQGNTQLLPLLTAEQVRVALSEIDLACERLSLLSDGWLLADPDPPPDGQQCGVADVLQQVVSVLRAAQAVEIDIAGAASAEQLECGIEARPLRALVYCALAALLRSSVRPAIAVRLGARGRGCTVHLHMACEADRLPTVLAPDAIPAGADHHRPRSISSGLWDVAQCLQRHGGGLRHAYVDGVFHLWLDLPPPAA